jgi:zeaxanthin glucosyltransferase
MAHVGLLCPTATGHLNPLLPLGRELQRRGHRVTVFQVADAQATVEAAELEFYPLGTTTFPLGRMTEITRQLGELSGVAAAWTTFKWVQQTTQLHLEDVPVAIQKTGVEVLIVDQILCEGETIAEKLGIPWITFCSILPLNRDITIPPYMMGWPYSTTSWAKWRNQASYQCLRYLSRPLNRLIQDYRRAWGLPLKSRQHEGFSPLLQLSQQPSALEYPRQTLPPWFHFVGPMHEQRGRQAIPFPYERLNGKPLIYASLGTLQNRQQWLFDTIIRACADLPMQLVLSLGNQTAQLLTGEIAGDAIIVPYAPQIDLLQRAALTITHAGLNTTLESLTYGVPLVAIPITNDQPGVAARIAWSGTGEQLSLKHVNPSRLQQAIMRVFSRPTYRHHAHRLRVAIQEAGGVTLAADLVEQVITTRKPVLRQPVYDSGSKI